MKLFIFSGIDYLHNDTIHVVGSQSSKAFHKDPPSTSNRNLPKEKKKKNIKLKQLEQTSSDTGIEGS